MKLFEQVSQRGWFLTEDIFNSKLAKIKSVDAAIKKLIDFDLKEIGLPCLPEGSTRAKLPQILGPMILQIQKIRNVGVEKDEQEDTLKLDGSRLLKLILTDGHTTCGAIELDPISKLSMRTPPGTKILLSGEIPISSGFLLIQPSNCEVLGGSVERLVTAWELKQSLGVQTRGKNKDGISSAPPWQPFGKSQSNIQNNISDEIQDFNSAEAAKRGNSTTSEAVPIDTVDNSLENEFRAHRQAKLAEALDKAVPTSNSSDTKFLSNTIKTDTPSKTSSSAIQPLMQNGMYDPRKLGQSASREDYRSAVPSRNENNSYSRSNRGGSSNRSRGGARRGSGDRSSDNRRQRRAANDDDEEYSADNSGDYGSHHASEPTTLYDYVSEHFEKTVKIDESSKTTSKTTRNDNESSIVSTSNYTGANIVSSATTPTRGSSSLRGRAGVLNISDTAMSRKGDESEREQFRGRGRGNRYRETGGYGTSQKSSRIDVVPNQPVAPRFQRQQAEEAAMRMRGRGSGRRGGGRGTRSGGGYDFGGGSSHWDTSMQSDSLHESYSEPTFNPYEGGRGSSGSLVFTDSNYHGHGGSQFRGNYNQGAQYYDGGSRGNYFSGGGGGGNNSYSGRNRGSFTSSSRRQPKRGSRKN